MRVSGISASFMVMALGLAACEGPMSPAAQLDAISTVLPQSGTRNVDPGTSVVVVFNRRMTPGIEQRFGVERGTGTSASVAGAWRWSDDGTRLTFTPAAALNMGDTYWVHAAGGMMSGQSGMMADHARHHSGAAGDHMSNGMIDSSGCTVLSSFST